MRQLLIIRHAIAHQRDKRRWPNDDARPLTRQGTKKFRQAARGIATITAKPDEVLCSPLVRTRQTARILRREAGFPRAEPLLQLRPEVSTPELLAALRKRNADSIAIVGHEPCLSRLLSALLVDQRLGAALSMKKGALALVTFDRGRPTLLTFLPPRILRAIG
ncbi:MAG: histidine phosphatase family protein [Steroidobacteraceae bacterium]